MATPSKINRTTTKTINKADDLDLVLLCNPQAGGRWKELAAILDSDEARFVRRIVTDSIDDIGPALASLSQKTQLICIYGGDGTIQRILNRIFRQTKIDHPHLAFIGGGTMNVTARWCGLRSTPGRNFRDVVRAFRSGQLLYREVPLLIVQQGEKTYYGFTFSIGPIVRVMDIYERGAKTKINALSLALKSLTASWGRFPASFQHVLQEMEAEILVNNQVLPYSRFAAVFANVTGRLNIGVEPFIKTRTRDTFYTAAYAVNRREFTLLLPILVRGLLPADPKSLLKPVSTWKQIAMSIVGKGSFPIDPRYYNDVCASFEVRCAEKVFTVDGEMLASTGEPIRIQLGPVIRLAVSSTVGLSPPMRIAANVTRLH